MFTPLRGCANWLLTVGFTYGYSYLSPSGLFQSRHFFNVQMVLLLSSEIMHKKGPVWDP